MACFWHLGGIDLNCLLNLPIVWLWALRELSLQRKDLFFLILYCIFRKPQNRFIDDITTIKGTALAPRTNLFSWPWCATLASKSSVLALLSCVQLKHKLIPLHPSDGSQKKLSWALRRVENIYSQIYFINLSDSLMWKTNKSKEKRIVAVRETVNKTCKIRHSYQKWKSS